MRKTGKIPAPDGVGIFLFVTRLGFEPKTHSLEGCCSIQLSYQAITFCGCKGTTFFLAWVDFLQKNANRQLNSSALGT